MTALLKPSAQKVQDALLAHGYQNEVVEFADSTRTAAEAAAGHPNALFRLTPAELVVMTGGQVMDVT